ncbi:MAG: acetyl-CoA carboxylase biotin carboxyl carrier protein [Saprospiraceae bacterium]
MDFNQIQELIRLVTKNKLSTFYLQEGDFKIIIRNQAAQLPEGAPPPVLYAPTPPVAQPAAPSAPPPPAAASSVQAPLPDVQPAVTVVKPEASNLIQIKSPMVGTFYRSASPDKPPFIKIGDDVEVGDTVCIIEAMKLFNEIESEVKGQIVKVLVEDSSPVEYDQPLFLIEPA